MTYGLSGQNIPKKPHKLFILENFSQSNYEINQMTPTFSVDKFKSCLKRNYTPEG